MRLKSFKAKNIHGFLNFDVEFNSDLSLITGINGSGKTTVLNLILALITPNLSVLSKLQYDSLELKVENEGKSSSIIAKNEDKQTILKKSLRDKRPFIYNHYLEDENTSNYKNTENEAEYYRDILNNNIKIPILKFIQSLPTPMFLGLDRRDLFDGESENLRMRRHIVSRQLRELGRNVFSESLTTSLLDAAALAAEKYRETIISSGQINEKIQQETFLRILSMAPTNEVYDIKLPNKNTFKLIKSTREDLKTLPEIFNINDEEINNKIIPILDELENAVDVLSKLDSIEQIINDSSKNKQNLKVWLWWNANKSQIELIKVISEAVKKYNLNKQKKSEPIDNYLKLINNYLKDSKKEIFFDKARNISVKLKNSDNNQPITYLSSGEAQIFVILTHLAFNPRAQKTNVFIIDEPELSLHIRWQELFVDSIISANPSIQYILATHSPSIILERTHKCIDISETV